MIILIYACTATLWCSTHSVMVPAEQVSIRACAASQVNVAMWAMQNPDWQVRRWDCKRIEIAKMAK